MKLTILTYNTLFAGQDGADDRRATEQIKLISQLKPDVGMRGFLAVAPRTGQNVAIFVRAPLTPLAFEADGNNFHHALATLRVALPGSSKSITFISAHLCPNGPAIRRREAAYLGIQAAPDGYALLAGDFNSASPHDH